MPELWVWWPVAVMAVDWVAVAKGWRRLEYVAKPGAMLALLGWLWLNAGPALTTPLMIWFVVGLVLSLAGDVWLMLPPRFFLAGLVSFLLAHVAYMIGFLCGPDPITACEAPAFYAVSVWRVDTLLSVAVVAAPLICTAVCLVRRVSQALDQGDHGQLRGPIMAYTGIITLMVIVSMTTLFRPDWPSYGAVAAVAGAELFFLSDGLLAWNRFVRPMRYGKLIVIVAYHLGQAGIVWAALGHLLYQRVP